MIAVASFIEGATCKFFFSLVYILFAQVMSKPQNGSLIM